MNRDEVKATLLEGVERFIGALPPEGNFDCLCLAWMALDNTKEQAAQAIWINGKAAPSSLAVNIQKLFRDLSAKVFHSDAEVVNES